MKIEGYTAFVLDDVTRERLLERFPPAYPAKRATHVTEQFGAPANAVLPDRKANIRITGIADDGIGSQALVAEVDGVCINPYNQNPYHITLSFDPSKKIPIQPTPPGKPRSEYYDSSYSGVMLQEGRVPVTPIEPPIEITGTLKYVDKNAELRPKRI